MGTQVLGWQGKRTVLVGTGLILLLVLLVAWLLSGTPFLFNYSRSYASNATIQSEPPIVLLTVTNDTLRPCDDLEYTYTIGLSDGAQILGSNSIGASIGSLGPYETKTFLLFLEDTPGGIIVVPPTGPARDMTSGELNGAIVTEALGYCVYQGILGPLD
jgi:hypothetical protein